MKKTLHHRIGKKHTSDAVDVDAEPYAVELLLSRKVH